MGSEDEIIFCQEDFMSKSFDAFEDMRRKEELVDFKINFENCCVLGHRLVLAARIPHLRTICSAEAEMLLKDMDPGVLESVTDFAYKGKIKITPGNAISLISVSKVLELPQVYDACWEFLKSRLHLNNVLDFRRLAEDHGCTTFLEAADNYIGQKFEEFTNSEGFVDLPFQQLKEIISRDDIKVSTEEKVFEAVIKWIKSSESERRDLLPELLSSVRMNFMTPDYLIERVSVEELVRSSMLCRDLVEEAKSYHLLPGKRLKFCHLPSQPRLVSQPVQEDMHHLSADVDPRSSIYSVYGSDCMEDSVIKVKRFDPEGERWRHVSSYKNYLYPDAVVSLGEMIYIFGYPYLYTFKLSTKRWSSFRLKDIRGSGIVAYKDKIYFFGGISPSRKVQCFDLKKKMFVEECPTRRVLSYPGVALLSSSRGNSSTAETFIYITGGYLRQDAVYSDVDRYNPETKKWAKSPSMFYKRYEHGCCHLKEKVYVCGGITDNCENLSSAEMFDPLTNQWNVIASMTEAMHSLSVTSHEDKLYVWGRRPLESKHLDKLEIYDPIRDEWKIPVRGCLVERRKCGTIFLVESLELKKKKD